MGFSILATVEHQNAGRLATVRLLPPGQGRRGIIADLLFASPGIEPEIVAAAEPFEIVAGLRIPVAVVGHLLALKLLSRSPARPQDGSDLQALLAVAAPTDLTLAEASLRRIQALGFHREKDLLAQWAELRSSRNPLG